MNVLVVDDETLARRRLQRLLSALPQVTRVLEAEDAPSALRVIATTDVDVVLLDIHMPGTDGLTLARGSVQLPPVIFVTAHDQHAVQAFEVNAMDYLLKPVRVERLAAALARVPARTATASTQASTMPPTRVVATDRGVTRLFEVHELTRLSSCDGYSQFRVDGVDYFTEEPLSALAERLSDHGFVRVHRSELVRLAAVRSLSRGADGYRLTLSDGQSVPVSRRATARVKQALAAASSPG